MKGTFGQFYQAALIIMGRQNLPGQNTPRYIGERAELVDIIHDTWTEVQTNPSKHSNGKVPNEYLSIHDAAVLAVNRVVANIKQYGAVMKSPAQLSASIAFKLKVNS